MSPLYSNYNYVWANENRALLINPAQGNTREDAHVALQEIFVDYHIRNVSDRFDFDSIRVGIQPITLDFRGFLFQDQQLGVRFFGTRNNNIWQYNVGWFRRLEKDTNSGLNDVAKGLRDDDIFFANLYRQDWPVLAIRCRVLSLTTVIEKAMTISYSIRMDFSSVRRPSAPSAGLTTM